jgi:sugar lactone lactonase YvrE
VSRAADVEVVLAAGAELGEAPTWDPLTRRLLWVDIMEGAIHRTEPSTGADDVRRVGQPVGAVVPTTSGRLAIAARDGFFLLDPSKGDLEPLASHDGGDPETLMNDGKCDPWGGFWAGTKAIDGRRPIGSLYRLGADRRLTRVLTGLTVSNGLGWSPDGSTMYHIDSPTHGVDAFDVDPTTGDVSNRRRLVTFAAAWGLPDGMTVDEEGFLWIAFWGGSAVRRVAPDGDVAAEIGLPVTLVTSCAFGGDDGAELFVTSAHVDLTPEERRAQPHAGALFRLRPGVRGPAGHPFVDR